MCYVHAKYRDARECNERSADVVDTVPSTYRSGEASSAVGEHDTELGELLKDASKDEGTDSHAGLHGHAHEPGQPVLFGELFAGHIPGVDEHARA